MFIDVDIGDSEGGFNPGVLELRRALLPLALDHWPFVKKIEAVFQIGSGADATSLDYPTPSNPAGEFVSFGHVIGTVPGVVSGLAYVAHPIYLRASDRVVQTDNGVVGGFFIYNSGGSIAVSSKMKIHGPARGCITKHTSTVAFLIQDPEELVRIDLREGEEMEVGPDAFVAGAAVYRVFWNGNEAITGFPRNITPPGLYANLSF